MCTSVAAADESCRTQQARIGALGVTNGLTQNSEDVALQEVFFPIHGDTMVALLMCSMLQFQHSKCYS